MQIKKNILKLFFISLLISVQGHAGAQTDTTFRISGAMFGWDISRFLVHVWAPVEQNFGVSFNAELRDNLFLSVEGGYLKTHFIDKNYTYDASGNFYRLGLEYNILKRAPDDNELIYVGLLYGLSPFKQKADHVEITNDYWGTATGSLAERQLTWNWIEFKAGIRVDLFKNFFLGWAIRAKFYLYGTPDPYMNPAFIPGYGRGINKTNFDMSYSLYYRIPYKIKIR